MEVRLFSPEEFFDLSDCPFADLFGGISYAWEALPKIGEYLRSFLRPQVLGEVQAGAYLIGKDIYIGEGTQVRTGAYVRGNVLCGKHCVIGHTSEFKNSILLNHAAAAHFNYVGDSILGNHTNLGAGTKLANLKNLDTPICIRYQGQTIDTGLRKFGAILGDGAKTGCNAVTNPGTLLGKNAMVYPCLSVRGVIPAGAIVKQRESNLMEQPE
jgi:NDP-sugar pyrophosphorylase family protein